MIFYYKCLSSKGNFMPSIRQTDYQQKVNREKLTEIMEKTNRFPESIIFLLSEYVKDISFPAGLIKYSMISGEVCFRSQETGSVVDRKTAKEIEINTIRNYNIQHGQR